MSYPVPTLRGAYTVPQKDISVTDTRGRFNVLYVYGDMDEILRTAVVLIVAKTVGFSSTEMKLTRWKPSAKIKTAEACASRKGFVHCWRALAQPVGHPIERSIRNGRPGNGPMSEVY